MLIKAYTIYLVILQVLIYILHTYQPDIYRYIPIYTIIFIINLTSGSYELS